MWHIYVQHITQSQLMEKGLIYSFYFLVDQFHKPKNLNNKKQAKTPAQEVCPTTRAWTEARPEKQQEGCRQVYSRKQKASS